MVLKNKSSDKTHLMQATECEAKGIAEYAFPRLKSKRLFGKG